MITERSSFLSCMCTNNTAQGKAGVGDNREGHRSQAKDGKYIWKRSIIGVATFLIIFAITCSLIVPGGLFNRQVALADTGETENMAINNASVINAAPLNPAYVDYINKNSRLRSLKMAGLGSDYALGQIPSPLDLSYMNGEQIISSNSLPIYGYPASYDLRTLNRVTSVKNQGTSGSCWAFATYGSLESNLLTNFSETRDFSENNLKNMAGFDVGPNDGGNYDMAVAYLTRWSGPVSESSDPYNATSTTSPSGLNAEKHVQNVFIIPNRGNSTDNDNIKSSLMKYGAIFTSMYMSDTAYYNPTHAAYYDNIAANGNHAVTIVGWDDGYSRYNFSTTPPGDGAFIVKNSWGSSFGDSGYFYVSYYDKNFGVDNAIFTAEPVSDYNHIYQYDPLGWTYSLGYLDGTAWFANIFTATSQQELTAVGFYTTDINAQYKVNVYSGTADTTTPIATASGSIAMAGYHTIPLNSPASLASGQKFRVDVKLTMPGSSYQIAVERPIAGRSSQAYANASESYFSHDGVTWSDVSKSYAGTDVCLKAYTVDLGPGTLQYSQSSYSVYENNGSALITVNRVGGAIGAVSVNYATNGGSATPGTDYTPVSGTLQFKDGETSKSFPVTVMDDGIYGSDKIVFLNLSSPTGGASLGLSAASLTIAEADGIPTAQFNASTYKVNENSGVVFANVTLKGIATSDVTINYATAGGTATSGSDFTATSGVLTFKPGDHSKLIQVSIINDSVYEPDQNFTITLSNPSSYAINGSPCTATVTIKDDDSAPSIRFQSQSYNVSEGGALATINVVLSAPSEVPIGVSYSTADGSAVAGMNYTQTSGVLQFASGSAVASFNVPIIDNYVINKNTTFNVSLNNPTGGASLGSPVKAAVNIVDDDQVASVTLSLYKGWNLVSLPLALQNNNIENIFPEDVRNEVVDIWGWDEKAQNFKYYSTKPGDVYYKYYPALTDMERGRAYWVEMSAPANVTIQGIGSNYPINQVQLVKGWNFVAPTSLTSMSTPVAMYPGALDVWGWDPSAQNFLYYSPDANDNYYRYYSGLTSIQADQGYWVEIS